MSRDKDPKRLLDKSIEFLRELSAKVQQEAGKTWQVSNLKFEIAKLRKKRGEKLKILGEKVMNLVRQGRMNGLPFRMLFEEIGDIEEQIADKDEEIEKIERENKKLSSSSNHGIEFSEQRGIKGGSMAASRSSSRPDSRSRKASTNSEETSGGRKDP